MTFQRILFPVDFSDRCIAAARYVQDMARSFEAELTLVHAADGSGEPLEFEESEEALEKFAAAEFPDADVTLVCEPGDPATLIERVSKSWAADLIMMPTRGRSAFQSAVLGSVTAKMLHDLAIPVWTDVHQEAPSPEKHLPIRNVICAIDLEPASVGVLRFASEFAGQRGATMSIAHGIPVTEMLLGRYIEVEPPELMEDFGRKEIAKLQAEGGTSAEVWLEGAPIADVVRNAALQHGGDLLIIGRGEVGHRSGAFWAHSGAIIRESPCPVLSV